MSYDLYFRSSAKGRPITAETFREYFSGRQYYQLQGGQAFYSNEDTGVYFSFDLSEPSDDPEAEPSDASFNLNYYRPHIFGLEAEPEVAAFVSTFQALIADLQVSGMGEGEYSRSGFLESWNKSNHWACRAMIEQQASESPQALPSVTIERFWRWNLERKRRQEQIGQDIFVPRIMFLRRPEGVASFVVWGDAIPILIPEVDFVVVARDELAPRKLFRRKMDRALLPWAQVLQVVGSYPRTDERLPCYRLDFASRPTELVSWVKGLFPNHDELNGIAVDSILDQDLLSETGLR